MDNATPYVGYWGEPDSIMDFCEPNYAVSFFFAEFCNSLSSVPMFMWGLLGLVLTHMYATKEFRYKLCFMALMFVGVGSFLFHASLRYKYQLLDELPMLLLSSTLVYGVLTIKSVTMAARQYALMALLIGINVFEVCAHTHRCRKTFVKNIGGSVRALSSVEHLLCGLQLECGVRHRRSDHVSPALCADPSHVHLWLVLLLWRLYVLGRRYDVLRASPDAAAALVLAFCRGLWVVSDHYRGDCGARQILEEATDSACVHGVRSCAVWSDAD